MSENVGFGSNRMIVALPPADFDASVEWCINLASQYWAFNLSREYTSQEGTGFGEDPDVLKSHQVGYAFLMKAQYIWFLSNKVLPPIWTTHRLLEAMRKDPKIMMIAGMCPENVPEEVEFLDDVNQTFVDEKGESSDVFEIAPGSYPNLECTVIRMEVFDIISEPWFFKLDDKNSEQNLCEKIQKAGYKVCAHSGVMCGHVDMKTGKAHWPEGALLVA